MEHVADFLGMNEWEIKKVRLNCLFSKKKIRELVKKIPREFDKVSISKFYEETGLRIKYYMFADQFSFIEYDRMGVHPDNDKWEMVQNGQMTVEEFNSHPEYIQAIEEADIIVIDKITKYQRLSYFKSNQFNNKKEKFRELLSSWIG